MDDALVERTRPYSSPEAARDEASTARIYDFMKIKFSENLFDGSCMNCIEM